MNKMKLKNILNKYENLSKKHQLNVASFANMKNELISCCVKSGLTKEKTKIERICNSYLAMRDGCEINSETLGYAIRELYEIKNNRQH